MDWTHPLRLCRLKVLHSAAQSRNVRHSAAMLNTSQPALSKWLKSLEDDTRLPLWERHARGLRRTPHGDVLIAHAQRVASQLHRASANMAALRDVGFLPAAVPEAIAALRGTAAEHATDGTRV